VKIAISGSAGTGKTTLATALAARQRCSLIAEGYDGFFDENFDFIKPAGRLRHRIFATLESKNGAENECGDFVADRCPADLFNLWLSRGYGTNQGKTADLYSRCRSYIGKYDRIVVLPWSALPLSQVREATARRRRTMNYWTQLYNHSTMIGLLQQWVTPDRLLPIPFTMVGLEARVALVSGSAATTPSPAAHQAASASPSAGGSGKPVNPAAH
jgi:AAA domain